MMSRPFFCFFSRWSDAGSGQLEKRRSLSPSGGAVADCGVRRKPRLRAGAVAARGSRSPRGSASCSNTRAWYIHVPLEREPLAATSFAAWRSSFRRDMPEPGSTKPRTPIWRKTRWCGDRAQAGHGWPALACWSQGRRNQAMRTIPALPRLPPKATNPGALRPHCRGSPEARALRRLSTWPDQPAPPGGRAKPGSAAVPGLRRPLIRRLAVAMVPVQALERPCPARLPLS